MTFTGENIKIHIFICILLKMYINTCEHMYIVGMFFFRRRFGEFMALLQGLQHDNLSFDLPLYSFCEKIHVFFKS